MASLTETFRHEPLDRYSQSIRVVQILPDLSAEGMIQCLITHITMDDEYCCLSYTWGEPEPCREILVSGKCLTVRQNLYDFLETARSTFNSGIHCWIDALCIDQSNSVERNDQVGRMGHIYADARCVYIWLGNLPSVAPIEELLKPFRYEELGYSDAQDYRRDLRGRDLFDNPYWGRAWIIQEIYLARSIQVILKTAVFPFWLFLGIVGYPIEDVGEAGPFFNVDNQSDLTKQTLHMLEPLIRLRPALLGASTQAKLDARMPSFRVGSGVIVQLACLINQKSAMPRDRIFSLLSLCGEGISIEVDYDVPDSELAWTVLKRSVDPLCLCSVQLIGNILPITNPLSSRTSLKRGIERIGPYIEFDITGWEIHPSDQEQCCDSSLNNSDIISNERFKPKMKATAGNLRFLDITGYHPTTNGDAASICHITAPLLRRLTARAVFIPSMFLENFADNLSYLGEEIFIPEDMRLELQAFEIQCRESISSENNESCGQVHLFANGFSYGPSTGGNAYTVRISLTLMWSLLGDPPYSGLCSIVESRLPSSLFTRLGYGPWNISLDLEDSGQTKTFLDEKVGGASYQLHKSLKTF
jgi:hypothetical protein